MFNLEQAVTEWRRQMAVGGIKTQEVLDELENHLREETEQQVRFGLSGQEAFEVAAQRIGKAGVLKNEFKKLGGPSSLSSRVMMSVGLVFVGFIVLLSSFTIFVCFESWAERVMAAIAVACILLVAFGWKYAVRLLPVIASARKRWAVGLACIACGFCASSFFCEIILPHFEVSPDHQLPAIGFWAVFLIASFSCAGVGLIMSEQERELWGMKKSARGKSTTAGS